MRSMIEGGGTRLGATRHLVSFVSMAPGLLLSHLTRYWAVWLALGGIAAAMAFGLGTGLDRLMGRWSDPYSYGHSYLVVPMALWLLFVGLRGTKIKRLGPSAAGFSLVLGTVVLYAFAETLDFTLGMQVAIPLVLLASVYALTGSQFTLYTMIPFAMLYFAIPIWDHLIPYLQDIATWVVTAWLRWTGITAHIDGHLITIRAGLLEIAEGCSGLRFVLVSLMLAAFFALSWLRRWRSRLVLVLVAALVSMLANWVRIFTLVLIGDWSAMEHSLITGSHYAYGWVVFYLFMAPLLWFALWLESREPTRTIPSGPPRVDDVARSWSFLIMGALIAALAASPALLRSGERIPAEPQAMTLLSTLDEGWQSVSPASDWRPRYWSPHMEGHAGFISPGGAQIDVFIARYLSQQPGSKLISKMNTLNPGWQEVERRVAELAVNGQYRRVLATELSTRGSRRVALSWYMVGGRPTHHDMTAKLLEIPALLRGRRDGAVIAVSMRCEFGCDAAVASLEGFVQAYGPDLEAVGAGRGL
jgi:EpsI family protein